MKIKKYYKNNLKDNEADILNRCSLIESISEYIPSIPKTKFIFYKEYLIYKQKFINKIRILSIPIQFRYELLSKFSKDLDLMCDCNLVHGDINFSNVLYDGYSLNLIDFEPCFRQIKNQKIIIKSGLSFRSINDFLNNTITSETDKIGFYFICRKLLDDKMYPILGRNLFEERKNGSFVLSIREESLVNMRFTEILSSFSN